MDRMNQRSLPQRAREIHIFTERRIFYACAFHTRGPWKHLPITPTRRADSPNWIFTQNYSCRCLWDSTSETSVVVGCRGLVCLTKGHSPLLRHQVSRTKALSSEQQSWKERSPSNVTGKMKGGFHHLYELLLVYYYTPMHMHNHPQYNLFTSWKYRGSQTGGGV